VILICVCAFMAALAGRLAWLQLVMGDELAAKAMEVRMREIPVEARRGNIYDRNGSELAVSVDVYSVFAIPAQVEDPAECAQELAAVLGMEPGEVFQRLTRSLAFVWVKRKIDDQQARRIRELNLAGIGLTQESKRYYPKGTLAAHIIGISGIDNQGLEGIELYYDRQLRGVPGRIVVEFDARGREMPHATHHYVPPEEGHHLLLTVDEVIQYLAERELEACVKQHGAKGGVIVAMDPQTGEVLAMACYPTYDPNDYQSYDVAWRRNRAVCDTYAPGSTFKPITAAAALEEGLYTLNSWFYCGGSIRVPGATVSCWRSGGHGSLSFLEIIEQSCNVGFVQVGLKLGAERFCRYVSAFELDDKTGIDFPGEARGIMLAPQEVKPVDLAVMAFGQTLTVTPIGLARAFCAIANGGKLLRPYLVKEIRNSRGDLVWSQGPQVVRQVISPQTARDLQRALEQVVISGTGRKAQVPGYRVAGKTGTAQKVEGGRIAPGKYMAWFVGYVPADDPRLLLLVAIDEPAGSFYGGQVAAPVFARIAQEALSYLEIPPRTDVETPAPAPPSEVEVPSLLNLSLDDAARICRERGLELKISGPGDVVLGQVPPPGVVVRPGTQVLVETEPPAAAGGTVTLPDLRGKTIREVAETLGAMGLLLDARGSGIARAQEPAPGSQVREGTVVTVYFEPVRPDG